MKRFELATIDRTTGKETTETVVAPDERAAIAMIGERNRLVARVLRVEDLAKPAPTPKPPSPLPPTPGRSAVIPRGDALGMTAFAWLLIIGGVFTVFVGLAMSTTTTASGSLGEFHNVGLLNDRLVTVLIGCAMFLGGIIVGSARMIVAAVQGAAQATRPRAD